MDLGASRSRRNEAERARRREIEASLARWRLLSRPRLVDRNGREVEEAALGRRLRGALEELGPVYAAFGRYLASRVDLLPANDCLELARIQARVAPLPAEAVARRLAEELGGRAGELVANLEPVPFESTLLVQSHRTRLPGGEPAIVRLARSETRSEGRSESTAAADIALLPAIAGLLSGLGLPFAEAAADFRLDLEQGSDLGGAVTALEMLAVDAEMFGRLEAPAARRDLSTSQVLTHTDLGGTAFDDPFWAGSLRQEGSLHEVTAIARQVCVVWLRQALFGRLFPCEIGTGDIRILPGGRIGLQGHTFLRAPATVQTSLRSFLIAVAAREPDGACTALLRETVREEGAASTDELLLHLRQIVPFRDGAWSASGESLAEHSFVYARIARDKGYRLTVPALAFHRSLFAVSLACRGTAAVGDPLADGLQELRLLTGFSQLSNAVRPDQLGGQLDRYALLLATLPQRIDELLERAGEGERYAAPEPAAPRGAGRSQVLLAAVALVVAALVLVQRHLAAAGVLAGQSEKVAAILFLMFWAWLLWALGRSGGTA